MFDIGAGDGDSAFMLAKLVTPGSVVAFEPEQDLARWFAASFPLHPDLESIRLIQALVGRGMKEKAS